MSERSPSGNESLTYSAAVDVIGPQLHGLPLVLVGGQALNYWVEKYRRAVPELEAEWPFTSEDVDFYGTQRDAKELARRLHAKVSIPEIGDATPNSGVLLVPLSEGHTLRIDILWSVKGIADDKLVKTALPAVDRRSSSEIKIMHPVLCMFSRAHNVIDLPGDYDTPHGLKQLRGSILCAREFIRERLIENKVRDALDLVELVFGFSLMPTSLRLWAEKSIDTFAAVELRAEYGSKFAELRHTQMVAQLNAARAKLR